MKLSLTVPCRQCTQIYGTEAFQRVYECLVQARYTDRVEDEGLIMAKLRAIVSNVRDCFLVEQLVFLEKQAEGGPS